MAIGNLFDNTRHNPPSWRAWSGDVSFRKEDIDYLVKEFNRKKENPKMTMNGELLQGKNGKYIQIKFKELYEGEKKSSTSHSSTEPKANPV